MSLPAAEITDWPLPVEPYIPGRTPRPDSGIVFDISHAAPDVTDPAAWRDHRAWLAGFRLYGHGYFWETHEVWEPVWIGARPNSVERTMVQGLIQTANACLKLLMGRPRAATRLATIAADCLREARPTGDGPVMGLDLVRARTGTERFAARLLTANDREDADAADLVARRPAYGEMVVTGDDVHYTA